MSNLVLSVAYTPVAGFPAGSVVAAIQASVVGLVNTTPVVQSVAPGTATVTFANLPADTYTISVSAVDAATPPDTFGTPITGTFTLSVAATVTLNLPSGVTATQS